MTVNISSYLTNMSTTHQNEHSGWHKDIFMHIIKVVYVIGIVGNAAAIVILRRGERRIRNRKHLLLMTTLAANDLVALMGMLTALLVSEHHPSIRNTRGYCAARVVLRVFGVGSVCIAVTMAIERYMALTRPFVYQKQVTYYVIRVALLVSWCWAAILTCTPIVGFGLYYDEKQQMCTRYRNAREVEDLIYAGLYVAFGAILCVMLVYSNLAVIRSLYAISSSAPVVRRVSKSSCRLRQQRSVTNGNGTATELPQPQHNAATAEEVAFSRLMATLSVLFMICWLPQMVTSTLYLTLGEKAWPRLTILSGISDLLMLLNYVLDPFLYVIMRRGSRQGVSAACGTFSICFKNKSLKNSTESIKTCPQETIILSENSSGGMEPKSYKPISQSPATAALISLDD